MSGNILYSYEDKKVIYASRGYIILALKLVVRPMAEWNPPTIVGEKIECVSKYENLGINFWAKGPELARICWIKKWSLSS